MPCPGHGTHPMTGLFDTASAMLHMKRRAFAAMVRHGGLITGVSDWMTKRIQQAFVSANLDTSRIQSVPNFVDIPSDGNIGAALPRTLPEDKPIILLVAANINNSTKGMITALAALQQHLQTQFTLVTVGKPFSDTVLQKYGLVDRTVQIGHVNDRRQLAAIYGAAMVTLVPSLAESFSLVAAESIACGTPVIASDVMALPDLVHVGRTGFLAQAGDSDDFSSKLRLILEMGPDEYRTLRTSTKRFATNRFISFSSWVDSYCAIYNRAIAEHV